ncbi:Symplekin tight junction protein C terminal-domain-containing protein [Phycomyces nitens]|nr:Symplekin tight junction protein C terminal-domain-containing protein [Phycomyces nitens]
MDHDHHLEQLRDFDQEVLAHPQSAQSFATNGFLDTLEELISTNLQKEENGEALKDDLVTLKDATRAFTTVLPYIFKTVCKNEAESRMWQTASSLISKVRGSLLNHRNHGLRIHAIKCLQVLILMETKKERNDGPRDDISLYLVRPDHRLLNLNQLEEEGKKMFNTMVEWLKRTDEHGSVLTAVISCLVPLVKKRPQFARPVTAAFVNCFKTLPAILPTPQKRNVEKAIRLSLVTMIRAEQLVQYRNEIISAFGAVGGNTAIFQSRQAREQKERERREAEETRRSKRSLTGKDEGGQGKRARVTEQATTQSSSKSSKSSAKTPATSTPNPLAGFDVTTLPLNVVVELCIAVLQNISMDTISQRIHMIPTANSDPTKTIPMAVNQPSTTPPPPPPKFAPTPPVSTPKPTTAPKPVPPTPASTSFISPQTPKSAPAPVLTKRTPPKDPRLKRESPAPEPVVIVKTEEAAPVPVEQPRVQLASAQERASQSLKMQPYELSAPATLERHEQLEMLKMSVQRIFDAEALLEPQIIDSNPEDPASSSRRVASSWNQSTKTMWLLLVAKLLTRGMGNSTWRTAGASAGEGQDMDVDSKVDINAISHKSNPDELKTMLLDFIVADLPLRYDLALEWLYEEFYCDRMHQRTNPNYPSSYDTWHLLLLEKGIPALDAKDKTLSRLLMDAPAISTDVIELIRATMAKEPARFVACASTLRDLVANRPPVRDQCLEVLLNFCISPDVKTRSTSIVVVKKWVPDHPVISPKVEEFATNALRVLTTDPPSRESSVKEEPMEDIKKEAVEEGIKVKVEEDATELSDFNEPPNEDTEMAEPQIKIKEAIEGDDDEDEEEPNEWSELDVVRHAELFFALCVKKHELLKDLFDIYIAASDRVQRLIRQHVYKFIKSIGMHSPKLIDAIRRFPPGGETLVIRILVVLCDTVRPSPELVNAVMEIYRERQLDAKFLIPIISGLRKEDIRQNLPKIVELLNNTEGQRKVVKKVFSRIVSSTGSIKSPMAPTELLMALHKMEENVPLQKAVEAINICFTMPDTFEGKHVATALQHLVEQPKIPLLLMVTMIRTVTVYKSLSNFILSLLAKLISKRVWAYPKLWDGFVKCTERTLPDSVKVLANAALPNAQLKDIVLRIPGVRSPLREYAEQNSLMRILVMMKDLGFIEE